MAWETPQNSKTQVNRAGEFVRECDEFFAKKQMPPYYDEAAFGRAWGIMANWRASHNYPLSVVRQLLRNKSVCAYPSSLVAQRLKRMVSIVGKLSHEKNMKLSNMQDIGGCRAIVGRVEHVIETTRLLENCSTNHILKKKFDYIEQPKDSGYRGIHLVYAYHSPKNTQYNGLLTEVQIRNKRQHAWATAVELVGEYKSQALKKSLGNPDWLRFFVLMGASIALREGIPSAPNTSNSLLDIRDELRELNRKIAAVKTLNAFRVFPEAFDPRIEKRHYFLIVADFNTNNIEITGYEKKDLLIAERDYLHEEELILRDRGRNAVLVSVDSLKSLRRAYPNYFGNVSQFMVEVKKALEFA